MLFADIKGFTAFSEGKTPREVVEMLSKLFTSFDQQCSEAELYKLYTIGDCYVVMSFVDKFNRRSIEDEALDVVNLAIRMIDNISETRDKLNLDISLRIGIHTVNFILFFREIYLEA